MHCIADSLDGFLDPKKIGRCLFPDILPFLREVDNVIGVYIYIIVFYCHQIPTLIFSWVDWSLLKSLSLFGMELSWMQVEQPSSSRLVMMPYIQHISSAMELWAKQYASRDDLINFKRLCLGWIWSYCESILAAVNLWLCETPSLLDLIALYLN